MASPALNPQNVCSECGAPLSASMRHCPTCRSDAGAPNVRRCYADDNLKVLIARLEASRKHVITRGCLKEFIEFEAMVKNKSGVVVSMPAGVVRKLFEDPTSLYRNYGQLVGSNNRRPADFNNDIQRCAVEGILFGSYAKDIVYGTLSLTNEGLPTYGDVHCRLRSVTIYKRTSFLVTNSYKYVRDHRIVAGDNLPVGYMACWRHRHSLCLSKLADSLSVGQTESDWQALMIKTDGKDRHNDDFIEAHIYENFDRNAIESMVITANKKFRKEDRLDIDIAFSKFNGLGGVKK